MSAAVEYYGWLLTQGYGKDQLEKFADYARRADRGEISHNKAYKLACKDGFKGGGGYSNMTKREAEEICERRFNTNEEVSKCVQETLNTSGVKGSFGDWMETAKEAGWIDAGLGMLGGFLSNRQWGGRNQRNQFNTGMDWQWQQQQEQERRRRQTRNIAIGAVALVGVGVAIYFMTREKNN